jgi:hypothetical protein
VSGRIELRQHGDVNQHILDGEVLAEGTRLQVLLENGTWLEGTYSWSGVVARWPGLRIELGGPLPEGTARRPMAVMALPPQAVCRRNPSEAVRPALVEVGVAERA